MSKSLLFSTYQLYEDAMRIANNQLGPDAEGSCVQQLVEQPAAHIETILERLDNMYSYLDGAYAVTMQRLTNSMEQERLIKERSDSLKRASFNQGGLR